MLRVESMCVGCAECIGCGRKLQLHDVHYCDYCGDYIAPDEMLTVKVSGEEYCSTCAVDFIMEHHLREEVSREAAEDMMTAIGLDYTNPEDVYTFFRVPYSEWELKC